MTTLNGGEVLVESLAREGIRRVFSMPGGQLVPVYDSIREHPWMDLVTPRHEGAATLMSCGHALAGGGMSVVMSTVGAGVIYEAPGLLYAWRERLPVLSISPQVQSWRMKPIQESLQACDQDEIYRPFTKFRAIVYHYDRIPQLVRRAMRCSLAPEPGPAHLDVPVDVLFSYKRLSGKSYSKLFSPGRHRFEGEVAPGEPALEAAVKILARAHRPVILAGRNMARAGAFSELKDLLEAWPAPVMTSQASFSLVERSYPFRLWPAGWRRSDCMDALCEADALLVLEADEDILSLVRELGRTRPETPVVQSAALMASLGAGLSIEAGLVGSPRAVARGIARRLSEENIDLDVKWRERLAGLTQAVERKALDRIGPGPRLDGLVATLESLGGLLKPGDMVVCEGSMAARAALATLAHQGAGSVVIVDGDHCPGAGLPLSMGMKSARPDSKIYLVTDTWSFKRHGRELQSMKRYGLGVGVCLFQGLDERPAEEVDFTALSHSLGVPAREIIDAVEEIGEKELAECGSSASGMLLDASRS